MSGASRPLRPRAGRTQTGMTSNAHLTQPRDSGKFSFKTAAESGTVRLGPDQPPADAGRPALDGMVRSYTAGLNKGSSVDRNRTAAILDLLQETAEKTGTDHEAAGHLRRRFSTATEDAYHAKNRKVAPLNIPGLCRPTP